MEIDRIRKEIDQIDDGILNLLNKRMDLVRKVGELKSASNSPIYRPEREKGIIDRLSSKTIAVDGLLNRAAVEAIFLEIFAIARNIELPEKIAFLGPEGSFTHQAAESRFGAMSEYMPLSSIKAVFEAIDTKRARFGVVPLENNQEGVVNETIDFLGLFDLHIVAEVPVPINFAFATKEDNVEDVKRIFSKDIAFKQCKKFLDDTFTDSEMELIPVNSTSRAVKMALEEKNAAAICSHIAARSFRLPILFDNIEDSTDNFTRFLIISQDF
ncbi:chorismate mutase, partial [Bacteroidota bacterium]